MSESRIANHYRDFKSWSNTQREIAENHEKHPYATLFYLKNEVETNQNRLQLSLRRGHVYAELDDWIHAEQEFARAIELDATDSIVHVYRLICIQHQADLQRFLRAFDQMRFEFQHSRNSSDINNLAWVACLIDEPLSERAALIQDLKRLLDYPMAQTMHYNLLNTLGTIQMRVGAWKEAKESIEKGVAVRGSANTIDDILLAMLEHHLDDHDSAKRRLMAIESQRESSEREIKKGLPPTVHWADRSVEQLLLQQATQEMSLEPISNLR